MSAWLGSYRQKHAIAETAKIAERPLPATAVGAAAYVSDWDMPAGYGICAHCGRAALLPAGPVDVECEACAVDRILVRAELAVDPRFAEDNNEVMVRGEEP